MASIANRPLDFEPTQIQAVIAAAVKQTARNSTRSGIIRVVGVICPGSPRRPYARSAPAPTPRHPRAWQRNRPPRRYRPERWASPCPARARRPSKACRYRSATATARRPHRYSRLARSERAIPADLDMTSATSARRSRARRPCRLTGDCPHGQDGGRGCGNQSP